MSKLRVGILGLPNVGKSTLFNALTKSASAAAANYPFCTIEPNVGVVEVPDKNLPRLAEVVSPEKIIPAVVEFVDIAGLVKGASKGEGLGNKFLSHVRESDALAEVIRFFEDPDVTHVAGKVDPKDDKETIETELIFSDLATVEKALSTAKAGSKSGDKKKIAEADFLSRLESTLAEGKMANTVEPKNEDEEEYLKKLQLLTSKKIIYIANVGEKLLGKITESEVAERLGVDTSEVIILSAKLESELMDLSDEEKKELLSDYNISEPGLSLLAKKAYDILSLQSFYTAGKKEVRAWTVVKNSTAPQAAGRIHTDFEKAFIRAEISNIEDFIRLGGWSGVRDGGALRTEGKDYIMKEGDVCYFLTSA